MIRKPKIVRLERRLTRRMIQVQAVALLLFFALVVFPLGIYPALRFIDAPPLDPANGETFADAIRPAPDGGAQVEMTSKLKQLIADKPGVWFVASTEAGIKVSYGKIPIFYDELDTALWEFASVDVRPRAGSPVDALQLERHRSQIGDVMVASGGGRTIGVLSFVVWAHHMFVSGMNPYFGFFFATTTLIIAIPTALKVYNWVLTLWRGDIHLTVPMLFAIGFISTFVIGGLTGLFLGNVSVDIPLSNTYFVVAHFHMVMGVSPILMVFGGLSHWYPKVTGRMLNDTLGRAHFWITFIGTYLIYFPMHYLGLLGMPRRYYAYEGYSFIPPSAQTLNTFITVIAIITLMWQISMHAMSITSATIAVGVFFSVGSALLLVPLVVLVSAARLSLKRHTPAQILAGTLVGALVPVIVLLLIAAL